MSKTIFDMNKLLQLHDDKRNQNVHLEKIGKKTISDLKTLKDYCPSCNIDKETGNFTQSWIQVYLKKVKKADPKFSCKTVKLHFKQLKVKKDYYKIET